MYHVVPKTLAGTSPSSHPAPHTFLFEAKHLGVNYVLSNVRSGHGMAQAELKTVIVLGMQARAVV